MSDFYIPFTETEEVGGIYRSRNLDGQEFRQVLQTYGRHGESLIARAEILLLCSGKFKDNKNGTLIIFRFTFNSLGNELRQRFTSAKISVTFSDFLKQMSNDPAVVTILPDRQQNYDLETKEISQSSESSVSVSANASPVNVKIEKRWVVQQTARKEYYSRLIAVPFNTRDKGDDNRAIWKLNEHTAKKQGVVDRFQTAVILRRNGDGKFRMEIDIETTVNKWASATEIIKKMLGKIQPEPVDPVDIDSELFVVKEIDIPELEKKLKSGEIKLDELDLSKYVGLV